MESGTTIWERWQQWYNGEVYKDTTLETPKNKVNKDTIVEFNKNTAVKKIPLSLLGILISTLKRVTICTPSALSGCSNHLGSLNTSTIPLTIRGGYWTFLSPDIIFPLLRFMFIHLKIILGVWTDGSELQGFQRVHIENVILVLCHQIGKFNDPYTSVL